MMSAKLWAPALTACTLAASIALVGCSKDPKDAQQAGAAQQMPPTEVGVLVAQPQNVEQKVELSGRTTAYQISEVRPQTSGVILKRLFTEGSYVREGQSLYELDSRTNRATLDNAKAALLQQEANLNSLKTKMNRYQQLVSSNAVSKQEYDDLVGQVNVAQAQVTAAKAQVKNAEVDLGYSTIRSPISGQSGRSSVTAGALVTANQTDPLVTIQQLDPIYVDINQSSAELLRLRQQLSKGNLDNSNNTKVKIRLEDGSTYPVEGHLAFSDASVSPDTGSVTLRAVFSNPNHLLLPGMYATAQITQAVIPNAYLIPQQAITRTPTGQATAMLVNDKGAVETRQIQTAGVQGTDWIVTEGLKAGDKVVVDGVAKVKEGQKVSAKPYQPQSKATPAQAQKPDADKAKIAESNKAQPEQKATSNT
ncbi:MAG TPA: AdeA/AdeI family multidrug efflux RND transporter periplasmic adaptor subunit [Acinetobacter ursingii]|uniref:AdeA/AdeI family multidrug efflux RND transporter periplasmic adaptor subunit n=1 Tax=Acinetobacter ursingii TaxID=108980 RepID=UPI0005CAAB6F|nr:AdeA/AdeI family multidrug efflux RND transporter periplasmic adaptor subunit [Acinetobacter ursingii]MCH2006310.1 AdeA/AdeI family multidrug efflux RND transporter periplasmic adaptor subunit [Acinetobacter ursingii]MCU4305087.1 AdeA/AdeI family multidrug efflux RND transporter periplasmic adaptor subunit [Acinetobacter ursingii]MCU4371257.1 AdeA/AdeI family multidrug efflux RND transporter periplasmic adaptor subunit [Acinetobacter ursingii]MCU4569188.1 AdeA/AdeI family multidrug efflux RN